MDSRSSRNGLSPRFRLLSHSPDSLLVGSKWLRSAWLVLVASVAPTRTPSAARQGTRPNGFPTVRRRVIFQRRPTSQTHTDHRCSMIGAWRTSVDEARLLSRCDSQGCGFRFEHLSTGCLDDLRGPLTSSVNAKPIHLRQAGIFGTESTVRPPDAFREPSGRSFSARWIKLIRCPDSTTSGFRPGINCTP